MVTSRNLSSCRAHTNSSVLYPSLLNLAIALQYHEGVERANSSAEDPNVMSLMRHATPFEWGFHAGPRPEKHRAPPGWGSIVFVGDDVPAWSSRGGLLPSSGSIRGFRQSWLKTLPTAGPTRSRMAITTIATRTRIKAYSTNPCPSSCGRNSILFTSLHSGFIPLNYAPIIAQAACVGNSTFVPKLPAGCVVSQ